MKRILVLVALLATTAVAHAGPTVLDKGVQLRGSAIQYDADSTLQCRAAVDNALVCGPGSFEFDINNSPFSLYGTSTHTHINQDVSGLTVDIASGVGTSICSGACPSWLIPSSALKVEGDVNTTGTIFAPTVDCTNMQSWGGVYVYGYHGLQVGYPGDRTKIRWSSLQTPDTLTTEVTSDTYTWLFGPQAYPVEMQDQGIAKQATPTFYIFGAAASITATHHYLSMTHNDTDAVLSTGYGHIELQPAAGYSVISNGAVVKVPSSDQSLSAGSALTVTRGIMRVVGNGGPVTITATPSLVDAADGTCVIIQGTDDTNTVTYQDESSLANSGLQLSGGNSFTLGIGDTLQVCYDSGDDDWYEVSRSNN